MARILAVMLGRSIYLCVVCLFFAVYVSVLIMIYKLVDG